MKSFLLLCLFAVAAYGLPAKKTDLDDSVESFFLFPGRQQKKEVPSVVEVEVGDSDEDTSYFPLYFRPLFVNPFNFMNFGFADFFSRPSWIDSLIPKGIADDAVKNSTSTTKVIDGHKVTVNETTYENEKNGAVFHFQVIDIAPVDSKEKLPPPAETSPDAVTEKEPAETATSSEELKPDQNSQDNEIRKEEMLASYELQGDDPSVYGNNVETFANGETGNVVDLRGDTRVNRLLAENARRGGLFMVPPEVEVFDAPDYDSLYGNYRQEAFDRQEVVRPEFNQQAVPPRYQQQQTVPPRYQEQQTVPPRYQQQQTVPPRYQQQAI